jgi:hypothetical protein
MSQMETVPGSRARRLWALSHISCNHISFSSLAVPIYLVLAITGLST